MIGLDLLDYCDSFTSATTKEDTLFHLHYIVYDI